VIRPRRLVYLLLVVVMHQSCAPPPAPVRRPGWIPTTDISGLLGEPTTLFEEIHDLTAAAQVTVTDEQTDQSASASVQYLPPQLMRIDVRGPLFRHVLTAVFHADTLWSLSEGRLVRLDARRGLVDLLGINFSGQSPREALLGLVVPVHSRDSLSVEFPRADRVVAVIHNPAGSQRRLWVDVLSGWVVAEEGVDATGQRRWRRQLGQYEPVGDTGIYLPRHVRIESGLRSIEIRYGEWRVDQGLSAASFFKGLAL